MCENSCPCCSNRFFMIRAASLYLVVKKLSKPLYSVVLTTTESPTNRILRPPIAFPHFPFFLETALLNQLALFHHHDHISQIVDVIQRVSSQSDNVGQFALLNCADLICQAHKFRRVASHSQNSLHWSCPDLLYKVLAFKVE